MEDRATTPFSREMLRIGGAMAGAALDPLVELAVSPPGISLLLDGFAPAGDGRVQPGNPHSQPVVLRQEFVSPDVFLVSVHQPAAKNWELRLYMVRNGLFGWKLGAVVPVYRQQ